MLIHSEKLTTLVKSMCERAGSSADEARAVAEEEPEGEEGEEQPV